MATYSNLEKSLQNTVWNFLRADSGLKAYTTNVLDGKPMALNKGTGYPFVLVHSPTIAESRDVLGRNRYTIVLESDIEIWTKQESTVREMVGLVRGILRNNYSDLVNEGFKVDKILTTNLNFVQLPDNSTLYNVVVRTQYTWDGRFLNYRSKVKTGLAEIDV